MNNNRRFLRSITASLAIFSILLMMTLPAFADKEELKIIITPSAAMAGSTSDTYRAFFITTHVPPGGFFFLDATIPAGYEFIFPPAGNEIVTYSMSDHKADKEIIVTIISDNPTTKTVDVKFSVDGGKTFDIVQDQPIDNIVIGGSTLKLTEPTSTTPGFLNVSLGGTAGPISKNSVVKLKMAKGTLKNPNIQGKYIWSLVARNSPASTPFTGEDVVRIK